MVGDGFVQTFDVLMNDLYLSVDIGGGEHLCDFSSYLPVGEWRVDGLHAVGLLGVGVALHLDAPAVGVVEQRVHSALTYQLHRGAECTEFGHARHVDAVAVGVSYLWRRADDNDLAGAQAVEYSEDALPQGGAAHNGVVDHYERVDSIGDASVGDVVDVAASSSRAAPSAMNVRSFISLMAIFSILTLRLMMRPMVSDVSVP